jgi:uncharacterized protein YndB with AHSA1/START domain
MSDANTATAIVKQTTLKASLPRVWRALSDPSEFGQWFGLRFDRLAFVPGETITGAIAPTVVDPEVAKRQEPHAGKRFSIRIVALDPMQRFAFQWHPFAIDPNADLDDEPMTTVTFALEEVDDGVRLTLTETGFELIPEARRATAFSANDGGWTAQMRLIAGWLARG